MRAAVTVELMEHADGRPVAYIDATVIAVFAYQLPDGSFMVDICTRDSTGEQVRIVLDGAPVKISNGGPYRPGDGPAAQAAAEHH